MNGQSPNSDIRTIFAYGALGRRQLKEVLSTLLAGLTITPQPIWLVSPWVSDFDLLDNQSGDWSMLQPAWGLRTVRFSELLAACVESGCLLNLVTKDEDGNYAFLKRLSESITSNDRYRHGFSNELHAKGLLTASWYLSGSMNFTFSGANLNDEQLHLNANPTVTSETIVEFEQRYASVLI